MRSNGFHGSEASDVALALVPASAASTSPQHGCYYYNNLRDGEDAAAYVVLSSDKQLDAS